MSKYVVKVVSYKTEWSLEFEKEKDRLLNALAPHIVTIEHAGSTSIPNQDAKPIIDMYAAVHPLLQKQDYAALLSNSGYRFMENGMTGRYLFIKEHAGVRTHHLHILPKEGFYERKELLFRDYLRAHPDLVLEYGELKRMLAERYHDDPEEYTKAKTAFILRVVDLARTERGLPLESVWET